VAGFPAWNQKGAGSKTRTGLAGKKQGKDRCGRHYLLYFTYEKKHDEAARKSKSRSKGKYSFLLALSRSQSKASCAGAVEQAQLPPHDLLDSAMSASSPPNLLGVHVALTHLVGAKLATPAVTHSEPSSEACREKTNENSGFS
jgi:hypothetical protein